MKNSPLTAMCAVALSLVATFALLSQSAIKHAASSRADSEQRVDEVPAPTLDPPDEIIKDLAGRAWSQLEAQINESLAEKDTIVVWLVDQSSSMSERRVELAERLEQNNGSDVGNSGHQLQHAVVSFAEHVEFVTDQPTAEVGKLADQLREIPEDPSGTERVMTAVEAVARRFQQEWKLHFDQNRIVVIVTDERGDDIEMVETVAATCAKLGVRVFCLGNASPFGAEKGYVRIKYADGFEQDFPVDQGPETIMHQTLSLPSVGKPAIQPAEISSGFGPFALELLCRLTGGQFLIYEDNATHRFPENLMQEYHPDYMSTAEFQESAKRSRIKLAILQAANMSHEKPPQRNDLKFRADSLGTLRVALTEAQKQCVFAHYPVTPLRTGLEAESKDRMQLAGKRWQASYDLALGQVSATEARLIGLNLRLAQMKVTPLDFQTPGNNTWLLKPAPKTSTESPFIARLVTKAETLLTRVIREHPGTPFAFLAKVELDRGFGWKWRESRSVWKEERKKPQPLGLIEPLFRPGRKIIRRHLEVDL